MSERKGMPAHYIEMYKGWVNEMNQSGWGKKFIKAKKEGITPELIFEYQRDYARELIDEFRFDDGKSINEVMEFVAYMVKAYVTEDEVRQKLEERTITPGTWAYLTAHYYE